MATTGQNRPLRREGSTGDGMATGIIAEPTGAPGYARRKTPKPGGLCRVPIVALTPYLRRIWHTWRAVAGGTGWSAIDLGLGHGLASSSYLELEANVQTDAIGGIFFDGYADDRFKFVALDVAADQVLVGHQEPRKGWVVDAAIDHSLNSSLDYDLKLVMKGSSVSVTVNGQLVTSHGFNAPVVDGDVGLLISGGNSAFDSFDLAASLY